MSLLSLDTPYVWFIFLELGGYLSCGVILINTVFTEQLPKVLHTLIAVLIMTVLMVPLVLISSPLTAYLQLFTLVALLFLYTRAFMPGKISGHIFWATVLVSSGTVITLVTFSVCQSIFAALGLPLELVHYLAALLVIAAHVVITAVLVRTRIIRQEESASSLLYFIVSLWFCVCMFILVLLGNNTSVLQTVTFLDSLNNAGTEAGMGFINVAIVVTLVFELVYTQWVVRHDRRSFETNYANLAQGYIANLDAVTTELRGLRHDLRNHLLALSGLVHKKDLDAITAYLGRIQETVGATDTLALTGNDTIDVVVSAKLAIAKQKGIAVITHTSALGTLMVDSFSIATIMGNLLDNAIEASDVLLQDNVEPGIFLSIKQQRGNCIIRVENNSIAPERHLDTYVSRKSEPYHGLGLIQVRRLVHDGNGHLETRFIPGVLVTQHPQALESHVFSAAHWSPETHEAPDWHELPITHRSLGTHEAPVARETQSGLTAETPVEPPIKIVVEPPAEPPVEPPVEPPTGAAVGTTVGIFAATVLLPTLSGKDL